SFTPVYVLRMIGRRPYKNRAITAGTFPIPKKGIRKASTAKLGIVCKTAEAPMIGSAIFCRLVSHNAKGIARRIAIAREINEISQVASPHLSYLYVFVRNGQYSGLTVCR